MCRIEKKKEKEVRMHTGTGLFFLPLHPANPAYPPHILFFVGLCNDLKMFSSSFLSCSSCHPVIFIFQPFPVH
jgi:hypothetical protein